MVLPLTQTPGGIQHFTYAGPIGVVGAPAQQTLDLTVFALYLRQDPHFADQLNIVVKSLHSGLTDALNLVISNDSAGVPDLATFDVYSDNVNRTVNIFVSVVYSPAR